MKRAFTVLMVSSILLTFSSLQPFAMNTNNTSSNEIDGV